MLCAGALLALLSFSASAQIEELTVKLTGLSAENDSSAEVVVTVIDSESRPLVDLAPDDFSVLLNGETAAVSALERGVDNTQPISVLLALDVSGSMEGGALDEAKTAAITFLNGLEPQDSIAVLTFADGVNLALPFTTDRAAATAAIDGLVAAGQTALYQATEDGLRLVAEEGTSYRAVILLSDGLDHGSALPQDDVLGTAGALGVPVFAIGLGQDIDRQYLESLAEQSGGSFAETPSPAGLAQLYQEAGKLLRGQYVLTLDTAGLNFVRSEPAILRIDVSLGDRLGRVERAVCAQELCVRLGQVLVDEQVEAAKTVTADVISSEPIASVSFGVDGAIVETVTEQPYQFTLDPAAFEDGERTLSVTVETVSGRSESSQVAFNIGSAGGGFNMMLAVAGAGVVVVVVVAAAFYLFSRRRHQPRGKLRKLDPANLKPPPKSGAESNGAPDRPLWSGGAPVPPPVEAMGRLYVSGGSLTGESFPVGGAPSTIGSGQGCAIRLSYQVDDEEQVAVEHMRVWVRDGRLMVHEIRRMTAEGAEGGRWAKLDPGETLPIGPYTFRFELGAEADPSKAVPNVLRDSTADPSTAPPDVLRDSTAVNEEGEAASALKANVEDEPTDVPQLFPVQRQPED